MALLSYSDGPQNDKVREMEFFMALRRFPRALWSGFTSFLAGARRESARRAQQEKSVHRTGSLEERNRALIATHLAKVNPNYRLYTVEEGVRECIQAIALAEGARSIAAHVYLSDWSSKATPEYLELKNSLTRQFSARYQQLLPQQKVDRVAQWEEKAEATAANLIAKYQELIPQFHEIAERKVSLLDDYGDESWDALPKEIHILITKIAKKEGRHSQDDFKDWKKDGYRMPEEYRRLRNLLAASFKEYHQAQRDKPSGQPRPKMSGGDFELFLIKLLKQNGFSDVRGTPVTGDQGADLIAIKNGRKIVIQAKCYEGAVGNRAVQEVASAVAFYSGDEGWVMTNSTFTRSAKDLAQRAGIRLFDGRDLGRFSDIQKE